MEQVGRKRFVQIFTAKKGANQPASKAFSFLSHLLRQRHDGILTRVSDLVHSLCWRHQDNAKNFTRADVCEALSDRIETAETVTLGYLHACYALSGVVYGNQFLKPKRVAAVLPATQSIADRILTLIRQNKVDISLMTMIASVCIICYYCSEIRREVINEHLLLAMVEVIEGKRFNDDVPEANRVELQEFTVFFLTQLVMAEDARIADLLLQQVNVIGRAHPLLNDAKILTHIKLQRSLVVLLALLVQHCSDPKYAQAVFNIEALHMLFRKPEQTTLNPIEREVFGLEVSIAALFHQIVEKSPSRDAMLNHLASIVLNSRKRTETVQFLKEKLSAFAKTMEANKGKK